ATASSSALEALCRTFSLSSFERDVVLLCAGVELDAAFAGLCAAAQGDRGRRNPTFGLTLAALDEPHWIALAPDSPLRRWRLIEVGDQPSSSLTAAPLRIDERVLHYLVGIQCLDSRLVGLVEPVAADGSLVPTQEAIARRIALGWG